MGSIKTPQLNKKTIDKLKNLCYNKYRKKEKEYIQNGKNS